MNLYKFTQYVNLDLDEDFEVEDIVKWFNKGISYYNLIPPLTRYPIVDDIEEAYEEEYPLDVTFLLGVMLPFVNGSIMSQESSVDEKNIFYSEFMANAREFKNQTPIPTNFLLDEVNDDLDNFRVGQNVFVSDMRQAPFPGDWRQPRRSIAKDPLDLEEE